MTSISPPTSSVPTSTDAHHLGGGVAVHELLARGRDHGAPEPVFSLVDGPSATRADVLARAYRLGGALRAIGVGFGDRVAVVSDNRLELLETWAAASAIGAVLVPINTAMRGPILERMFTTSEPVVIVVEPAHAGAVAAALHAAAVSSRVIEIGPDYDDELARAEPVEPIVTQPGTVAGIFFTSGTTGVSKGVMATHEMMFNVAWTSVENSRLTTDDVLFSTLPLFHFNALLCTALAALACDGRAVFAERFSVTRFWQQIADSGATVVNFLGGMGALLWQAAPTDLDRAHRLRIGLAIPSPPDVDGFESRFGVRLTQSYGLTDAGTITYVPYGERRLGSCGKVHPLVDVRLVDDHGNDVGVNEAGELLARPLVPHIFLEGYWRDSDATAAAWVDGWFKTGDRLRRDAEGWFYFVDRAKDAIRRSGENISSFEVEGVLLDHPRIEEAAVIGVPSDLGEEDVMAFVVVDGSGVEADEIFEHARAALPYFAVPRYLEIRDELPKTTTGKVQKHMLRAEGISDRTIDQGPTSRSRSSRS
jgi:crotonobetaine/carnitine-CoA ligase